MLKLAPACSGASDDWPKSSCPGPAMGLTNTDTSVAELRRHLLRTVTGAFAQCVAIAVRVPPLSTLSLPLYAEATSNSATSWIVVPNCERTTLSGYVQLTALPGVLKVATTPMVRDLTSVDDDTDGVMALSSSAVSEIVTLRVALSSSSEIENDAAPAAVPW